jgi:hypothetical protein
MSSVVADDEEDFDLDLIAGDEAADVGLRHVQRIYKLEIGHADVLQASANYIDSCIF